MRNKLAQRGKRQGQTLNVWGRMRTQRKTSSSSTGLPLKSKSVKDLRNGGLKVVFSVQWETYCRIINVSDYKMIETRLSQNLKRTAPRPFVVVMAKFDSVKDVWLPTPALLIWRKIQISAEQACIMEKSQWRDMSMSEDGNPVCTYSGANSCKKFGFVTTSIELNEHDFWARCTVRVQRKQVPVQLDCH